MIGKVGFIEAITLNSFKLNHNDKVCERDLQKNLFFSHTGNIFTMFLTHKCCNSEGKKFEKYSSLDFIFSFFRGMLNVVVFR